LEKLGRTTQNQKLKLDAGFFTKRLKRLKLWGKAAEGGKADVNSIYKARDEVDSGL
jgi:hypothetical protein